jgi:ABC-2 type transport system permease protein
MLRVLLRMTWIEIKLLVREPVTLIFSFAFPLLVLVLLGGIFGQRVEHSGLFPGIKQMQWFVPSYIALVTASIGTISVPVHLATYRERGVLRRFRASGVSEWTLLGSQLLIGLVVALVGALVIGILGAVAYDVHGPDDGGLFVLAFVAGVFTFSTLGVLLTALAPTARAAQGVGLMLWFVMMFLSGTDGPLDILPNWMLDIGKALPLYHVVIAIEYAWNGRGLNVAQLALLGVAGAASAIATALVFRWE